MFHIKLLVLFEQKKRYKTNKINNKLQTNIEIFLRNFPLY